MNGQHAAPEGRTAAPHEGNGHQVYAGESYYRLPPVKHSTYHWMIAVSYFSIGLAGAAQVMSTVLDLADLPDKSPMVRSGRYAALAGSLITPALYIVDLGTPRKWYNMLRIYRRTSLMSVGGAWFLTAFGTASGAVALGQLLDDAGYPGPGSLLARTFSIPAALAGGFMSTYMGTELAETSTPLWAETSPLLAPLFGLSNAADALALFELTGDAAHSSEDTIRPVRFLTMLTEAAAVVQLRRLELRWTGTAGKNTRSRFALLYFTGLVTLAKAAGIILRGIELIKGGDRWRTLRPLASLATLASGYALPLILLEQGNRSADRPGDYFTYASPGHGKSSGGHADRGADRRPAPPRSLSMLKWLAIGGLAVGTFALFMRPKKAY